MRRFHSRQELFAACISSEDPVVTNYMSVFPDDFNNSDILDDEQKMIMFLKVIIDDAHRGVNYTVEPFEKVSCLMRSGRKFTSQDFQSVLNTNNKQAIDMLYDIPKIIPQSLSLKYVSPETLQWLVNEKGLELTNQLFTCACISDNVPLVEAMLEIKVFPLTAYIMARVAERDAINVLNWLIKHGCEMDLRAIDGAISCRKGRNFRILYDAGAPVEEENIARAKRMEYL